MTFINLNVYPNILQYNVTLVTLFLALATLPNFFVVKHQNTQLSILMYFYNKS